MSPLVQETKKKLISLRRSLADGNLELYKKLTYETFHTR
jgi:hypothetical protein